MSTTNTRRLSGMNIPVHTPEVSHNEEFILPADNESMRFFVDYEYRVMPGTVPRLRLSLYCYDDRVSLRSIHPPFTSSIIYDNSF